LEIFHYRLFLYVMEFKVEKLTPELQQELQPLLYDHWQEIARHKDAIKLEPIWELYYELQDRNCLVVVTFRDEDKLVGYIVTFVSRHPHYRSLVIGQNDIIYIDPAYRKGTHAYRLIKFSNEVLKEAGVMKITMHLKIKHDFGSLLQRIGFKPIECIYELDYIGGE